MISYTTHIPINIFTAPHTGRILRQETQKAYFESLTFPLLELYSRTPRFIRSPRDAFDHPHP